MWPIIITLVAIGAVLYYRRLQSLFSYWEKRGIPSLPGYVPYGSYESRSDTKKFQGYSMDQFYNKMSKHQYFGYYEMRRPLIVARDPEVLKIVLTKEFSHFRDRMPREMPKTDPLIHYQLFTLRGDRWRALRTKLTPTFTSGRMKAMFPLFVDCSQALSTLLWSQEGSAIDVKDVVGRFTADVISCCAFGLQTNTVAEPDHPLRIATTEFCNFGNSLRLRIKFIVSMVVPFLLPLSRFTSKWIEDYIMQLISDTVEYREKNHVTRNDFLDLLIHLKNKGSLHEEGKEKVKEEFEMSLEVMAAQCFLFFIAGYETSSSVQTFCLYELALHQDIQEKLREEIQEVIKKHGGVTYQAVNEMKYLDMVVSEGMRKYPTLPQLVRTCVEPLSMPDGGRIEKGDQIVIPVWSLHHDPQYFPNPENFDPERFSPDNEGNIKPYTYLPFGEGPRMCIGNRFGLLQTKVGLITVIRNFQVIPSEKTSIPLKLVRSNNSLTTCEGPVFLKLKSTGPRS
ncbi:cytochrome P450 6k1 [Halyomorpha halys]|uniref:cytochrome P450 6k1 n=1 Tax=Halyomorpha halys TaxID=286706 RepID=UPI0006D4F8E5|nr:cytochrome P450 6k1 [Halyomorpha halys]XP_024214885.1 cytochrome P450 6k1 [Halyomorpha halys]XP_024214886.1 cytochrome P450 6k1 [Halyomorpha halys]XP_024214887.1 cytochrome P450 6k1 [Halyomorpha halys]XP_024214888.1 cytochrome P450 6k1 [Halyomorpha halys]XP_024214889.1 cytochrome P450 6k1 [Halyomorpha halys]